MFEYDTRIKKSYEDIFVYIIICHVFYLLYNLFLLFEKSWTGLSPVQPPFRSKSHPMKTATTSENPTKTLRKPPTFSSPPRVLKPYKTPLNHSKTPGLGIMAKATVAGLISALASAALSVDHAYADGPFNFPPFSSSSPAPSPPKAAPEAPPPSDAETSKRVRNDNPRTTSAGFDPEALERGAKALREITSSSHAKKVLGFWGVWLLGKLRKGKQTLGLNVLFWFLKWKAQLKLSNKSHSCWGKNERK